MSTHVPGAATFQMHFQKRHTCKQERDTLPHLRRISQVIPITHTAKCEGGRANSLSLMGVCAVFVCALLPPSPFLPYYLMCCRVHMRMQNLVCAAGGGGAHLCMHASSVLVAISVCAMHPPTHCGNLLFVFYLFYQSKLEQFMF